MRYTMKRGARHMLAKRRHPSRTRIKLEGGNETVIRLHIDAVDDRVYLATSPDVPGLVAEGRSVMEAVEIAQGLTRKIVESCLEYGDPLPSAFAAK